MISGVDFGVIGANLRTMKGKSGCMYKGPNWFTEGANNEIYKGIYR
jgi:hypothetical protein